MGLALLLWMLAGAVLQARADASVRVCFNYACADEVGVWFAGSDLLAVGALLASAGDAQSERNALTEVLAALYRVAGGQTPVFADRAGNLRDAGVEGRMDCIDHAVTTTRLLGLLEARGWLRYHRILSPQARRSRLILQHYSAAIEETRWLPEVTQAARQSTDYVGYLLMACDCGAVLDDLQPPPAALPIVGEPARFAVDSWFVDHGEPVVILPLADWLKGEGPNVH